MTVANGQVYSDGTPSKCQRRSMIDEPMAVAFPGSLDSDETIDDGTQKE